MTSVNGGLADSAETEYVVRHETGAYATTFH